VADAQEARSAVGSKMHAPPPRIYPVAIAAYEFRLEASSVAKSCRAFVPWAPCGSCISIYYMHRYSLGVNPEA